MDGAEVRLLRKGYQADGWERAGQELTGGERQAGVRGKSMWRQVGRDRRFLNPNSQIGIVGSTTMKIKA
jgi:hypothetical protein